MFFWRVLKEITVEEFLAGRLQHLLIIAVLFSLGISTDHATAGPQGLPDYHGKADERELAATKCFEHLRAVHVDRDII